MLLAFQGLDTRPIQRATTGNITMPFKIHNWSDISGHYSGTLLTGNGASRAVDSRFEYNRLLDFAFNQRELCDDLRRLFDFLETDDFEMVLRLIWHAAQVNQVLEIPDGRTQAAYDRVREALINAVRATHPDRKEIAGQIPAIYEFVKKFNTVLTLNYDLILYWVVMHGKDKNDGVALKDCFAWGDFREDWREFRRNPGGERFTTLLFYPHGNLALARDLTGSEMKLENRCSGLLQSIFDAWNEKKNVPLFVSEGVKEQKVKSIRSSNYLRTVYREVLADLSSDLVVYGWSFGEQDLHVLKRLAASNINRFAVSVHADDQQYCEKVRRIIRQEFGSHVEIEFFDSRSPGCWNNP